MVALKIHTIIKKQITRKKKILSDPCRVLGKKENQGCSQILIFIFLWTLNHITSTKKKQTQLVHTGCVT